MFPKRSKHASTGALLKKLTLLAFGVTVIGSSASAQVVLRTENTTIRRDIDPKATSPAQAQAQYTITLEGKALKVSLTPASRFGAVGAAAMGGKDGGGGDPSEMVRSFLVKTDRVFSDETLSGALLAYFGDQTNSFRVRMIAVLNQLSTEPHKIKNEKVRKIFARLIKQGLLRDIANSPLIFKNECFITRGNSRISRAATALMNQPGTPICLDPIALAQSMSGAADSMLLFGFVVHEYVHHFGYEDADYAIANELALTLRDLILNARASRGYSLGDILFTLSENAEVHLATPEFEHLKICMKAKTCFAD